MSTIEIPKYDKNLDFALGKIAFSGLGLSPESSGRRKTILTEVVKDEVWTLEQVQGIINVNVPVRSTVIKLSCGGLWINNPVAPTKECINMVRTIEEKHGNVKYIMLSTLGVEHKGTTGAFRSNFPGASVYVQPGQYAFPVNLPAQFFFPIGTEIKEIPRDFKEAPWSDDIEHLVLDPLIPPGVGGFSETAFFHKKSQTLLVTDLVINVDDEPPAIIQDDPRALLYHARDTQSEVIEDTKANRLKGWRRMVLFGLGFQPGGIQIRDTYDAIKGLKDVTKDMKKLGDGAIPLSGGLYPWDWVKSEMPNFKALQGGVFVAPILQKLILNRDPEKVLAFVNEVSKWNFKRIIPCHLGNDIKSNPREFREAFSFLEELGPIAKLTRGKSPPQALEEDCELLNDASKNLAEQGVIYPVAPLVKRPERIPTEAIFIFGAIWYLGLAYTTYVSSVGK